MDFSFSDLNFNSVVTDNVAMLPMPGVEARAAFYRQLRVSVPRRRGDCVYRRGRYPLLYPMGRRQ